MNFIIQENLTLDVEHPISFCQDILSNLENLVTRNYCNKFINNRFYLKVLEIVGYTDVFIQCNNSGFGSITCVIKFQCLVYTQNTIIFDLDIIGTELNKNTTVYKCTSNRYPKITFMTIYNEKLNGTIPMGKIISIGINKASENIIIFDILNKITPILLPYDLSEELKNSEYNKILLSKLEKSSHFNALFLEKSNIDNNSDTKFVYEKGVIYKGTTDTFYQDLTNVSDKELCLELLDKVIYNLIQF